MLTDREKHLTAQAYRALCEASGFAPRSQQQKLIKFVANAFAYSTIGLSEAPTGTGKSVGYLLPGIIMAISRDKRLVVSTATAALQDQLFSKDVPAVLDALAAVGLTGISVAVAKGRERHICPMRLTETVQQGSLFADDDTKAKQLQEISDAWQSGDWNGLKDTLPLRIPRQIWLEVANSSASCVGEGCDYREECPYVLAVDAAKRARVIVTNHDYLLASLANDTKSVVCETEENFYAFDEAHHLGDKCLSAFAKSIDMNVEPFDSLRRLEPMFKSTALHLEKCTAQLKDQWSAAAQAVQAMIGDGSMHRFTLGECPQDFATLLLSLSGALKESIDCVNLCLESLEERAKKEGRRRTAFDQVAQSHARAVKFELESHLECLEEFVASDNDHARWLYKTRSGLEIKCSPFDSAVYARKYLWSRLKNGVVLTSATLSTLGTFDSVIRSLGLHADVKTIRIDSPLDYSRARLRVPRLAVEAGARGHLDMTIAQIRHKAFGSEDVGCLVYFTSKTMLKAVYDALTPQEQEIVLRQGEVAPSAMVTAHKQRIDNGLRSVMFGLDSLGEGIDLPGRYCTKVFIPRLPFPPQNDPVLATHAEHLSAKGLHPFTILQLPRAGIKLAQICGRLIRRNGDWGDIVVLDNRLRTKNYGLKLLAGTGFTEIAF